MNNDLSDNHSTKALEIAKQVFWGVWFAYEFDENDGLLSAIMFHTEADAMQAKEHLKNGKVVFVRYGNDLVDLVLGA